MVCQMEEGSGLLHVCLITTIAHTGTAVGGEGSNRHRTVSSGACTIMALGIYGRL